MGKTVNEKHEAITLALRQRIQRYHNAGMSLQAIAIRVGLSSRQAVQYHLKQIKKATSP